MPESQTNTLECHYDQNTNILTFIFSGHLDSARSAPLTSQVEAKMAECIPSPPQPGKPFKVVFDLKEVDFISSAFIRICMMVFAKVKAGNLILQNANPFIKKTIKISGLEGQLTVL